MLEALVRGETCGFGKRSGCVRAEKRFCFAMVGKVPRIGK